MSKSDFPPSEFLYPAPLVLVSSIDKKTHKPNIITIAWCGVVCSNPPLLGVSIRPSRHSHKLIKTCRDFVINIPSADLLEKADLCGIVSGSRTDKFKACSFTAIPSSIISSPMIKECPVNVECRLVKIIELGSHDLFIGEVVAVHADEEVSARGGIDFKKASPVTYCRGEYWNLGHKIGHYGYSKK